MLNDLKIFFILIFSKTILCSYCHSDYCEGEMEISENLVNCRVYTENVDSESGNSLFLTPLIDAGKLEEARNFSVVEPFLSGIESHAGFLTVDDFCNSNLFFWFFKCAHDWESAPVTVWLQGGPGTSGLLGLFLENGPYILRNGNLYQRHHSWHMDSNIIFIDNPVGTGFSFTDSDDGYAKNQTVIGEMLYNAVKQLFTLFPHLVNNKFFIAGESYGGKYVPALGYTIHKYNSLPENNFRINLQGLLIGNGFTDPLNMMKYGDYLYQLGLIDFNELDVFHDYENKVREHIINEHWEQATDLAVKLILGFNSYQQGTYFRNVTGFVCHYNYIEDNYSIWTADHTKFVNSSAFRKAVHVGNKTFDYHSLVVGSNLKVDAMKSVLPWVVELLDHYRVLFYNGQLDVICAYPLTDNFLKNMKWKYSDEFSKAKRQKWKVDNDIAGYIKTVGNLTQVLVRDAGHLVPVDQPLWSQVLFKKFITNSSLTDND